VPRDLRACALTAL